MKINIDLLDELIEEEKINSTLKKLEDSISNFHNHYDKQLTEYSYVKKSKDVLFKNPKKDFKIFIKNDWTHCNSIHKSGYAFPTAGGFNQQYFSTPSQFYLEFKKQKHFLYNEKEYMLQICDYNKYDPTNSMSNTYALSRTITPLFGYYTNCTSFLKILFFYPNVYESFKKHLTEPAIDFFDDIEEKYLKTKFPIVKNYEKINIETTKSEKKFFEINTNDLSFVLSITPTYTSYRTSCYLTGKKIKQDLLISSVSFENLKATDKIFLTNHLHEITPIANKFIKNMNYLIKPHVEFMDYFSEQFSKFSLIYKL